MMRKLLFVLLITMFSSCNEAIDEYCHLACRVVIYNDTHLNSALSSAMNASAPGIFCKIYKKTKMGASYFVIREANGDESEIQMHQLELKQTQIVGQNNGVIIGFSNINMGTFYAFDSQCPNCYGSKSMHTVDYTLELDSKSHALCTACKREYDLNNRGLIVSGTNGEPLYRYPASTTGPFGTLVIQ